MKGENERLLIEILNESYPGQWVEEHMGIDGRKYRFDAANIRHKVAIEIEGGTHPFWMTVKGKKVKVTYGRHTRPQGYEDDCRKYNLAQIEGWRVLRYTSDMLRKTPWQITSDVMQLIGAPTKGQVHLNIDVLKARIEREEKKINRKKVSLTDGQSHLCFDGASSGVMSMQVKL